MTSQINPNNIDGNYPVAGQPNNTQGFRDNFTNTKTNFQYAADEINDLQGKAVLKSALTGTTLDNNMGDNLIYAVQLNDVSWTELRHVESSGSINLDYSAANYQSIPLVSGNISLDFSNWPIAGTVGSMKFAIAVTNTAYTLTLPATVKVGIKIIDGISPGTPGVSNTITFSTTGTYIYEFETADGGATISIEQTITPSDSQSNRFIISNTTPSISTTTGALTVAGGVGIGGNVYAGGLMSASGNVSGSNLITVGVITATGNVTGGNVITSGSVLAQGIASATGNITGGNIRTTGQVSATGNIYGGNLSVTGNITGNFEFDNVLSATGNVIAGNLITAGYATATGNVIGGNIITSGLVTVTGNVTAGNILTSGLISATSNVNAGNMQVGTTIYSPTYAGVRVSVIGNVTGANVTTSGLVTATGNITGGNILTGGLMNSTGNITGGNILTGGLMNATGNILTTAGNITIGGGAGKIGYDSGTGGTVGQSGNKSAGVTLNTQTGEITMQNTSLAADTTVNFLLTNSIISATDLLLINQTSTANSGGYVFNAICGAGNANIAVRNIMASAASDAIVLRFAVVKGSIT